MLDCKHNSSRHKNAMCWKFVHWSKHVCNAAILPSHWGYMVQKQETGTETPFAPSHCTINMICNFCALSFLLVCRFQVKLRSKKCNFICQEITFDNWICQISDILRLLPKCYSYGFPSVTKILFQHDILSLNTWALTQSCVLLSNLSWQSDNNVS